MFGGPVRWGACRFIAGRRGSVHAMTNRRFTELAYERRGPAGWITLDRPSRRNALSPTMLRELHEVLDLASRDAELRLLVITGSGGAFCTGTDAGYYWRTVGVDDGISRVVDELVEPFAEFVARLRNVPYPVIAAVNGACLAAGLEIVRCCDLIITETREQSEPIALHRRVEKLTGVLGAQPTASLRELKAMAARAAVAG
ncbi:MAG TPA: enoyl-CoA hydratase/isomerase family protein [Pseudonocardiaceae bacterium]|jgi:enoyl-CoA hydratase/carnithine racemase|nr:enoyl-CoA hydratase/isomerase family protein [Pseudonocardiaceae bacterium]